jgi:metal-sulfur cluster biosynthetic enzyme
MSTPLTPPELLDKTAILSWLKTVIDPEAGINIVDMGLIYDVQYDSQQIMISMTMTSPACPVGDLLIEDVERCIRSHVAPETLIKVALTFNPLWEPAMMSEQARESFGW